VKVLEHNGCEVVVPPSGCCGIPHLTYGDLETARRLARQNIEAFDKLGVEAVIVDCASCGHTLKSYPELLSQDPHCLARSREFSAMVMDVSEYLIKTGLRPAPGPLPNTVTYHDPCHAIRGMGVVEAPREVLKSIPGVTFIEMAESDWCCGGAGSYALTHYDLSKRILDRKMKNYQKTETSLLATSCPACMMHLAHGMAAYGLSGRVIHPIQLLCKAYEPGAQV